MKVLAHQVAQTIRAIPRPAPKHLTDAERKFIIRRYRAGDSQRTIAQLTGRPRTTIVNTINKYHEMLRSRNAP